MVLFLGFILKKETFRIMSLFANLLAKRYKIVINKVKNKVEKEKEIMKIMLKVQDNGTNI